MEYDGVVLSAAVALVLLHCVTLPRLHGSLLLGAMVGQAALHLALLLYFAHRLALSSPLLLSWGLLYVVVLLHACTVSVGPVQRELDIAYVARLLRLPATHVRCVMDAEGYFPLEEYHSYCTSQQGLAVYRLFYARYFPTPCEPGKL